MAIDPKNAALMRRAGMASVAAAVTLILIKLYAFIETGSVSMLSTLFDSALDFGASLINLFAISQAVVPADAEHRFGHGKAEPLAGLVQVGFILGSSILLLWEVVDHFMHPQQVQNASLGVVVMVADAFTSRQVVVDAFTVAGPGLPPTFAADLQDEIVSGAGPPSPGVTENR